jgi:hypothetical protein
MKEEQDKTKENKIEQGKATRKTNHEVYSCAHQSTLISSLIQLLGAKTAKTLYN